MQWTLKTASPSSVVANSESEFAKSFIADDEERKTAQEDRTREFSPESSWNLDRLDSEKRLLSKHPTPLPPFSPDSLATSDDDGKCLRAEVSLDILHTGAGDDGSKRLRNMSLKTGVESWQSRLSQISPHSETCLPKDACARMDSGLPVENVDSFMARSTLTLQSPYLLRATTSDVLIGGMGWRLRSNTGGIGISSGDNEFDKSFPVAQIDVFLSHSWHAWWLLKYITLLLYFNALPASIAAMLAGIATRVIRRLVDGPGRTGEKFRSVSDTRCFCLPIGGIAFVLVLFSWHRIARRCCYRPTNLFLDKVCIHQTDPFQKEQGIKAIGGILNNSNLLLIAWDATYFERLWCIFELAAFKFRQQRGTVVFLPIMLGATIAVYSMMGAMNEFVRLTFIRQLRGTRWEVRDVWHTKLLWDTVFFLQNMILIPVARNYGRDVLNLRTQLRNFSVHQAKCYCCDNNHQAPNGDCLACDRELVYSSIAHWHGNEDLQVGLERFDQLVQKDLRKDVVRTLGGLSLVPYPLALSFSIWNTLYWMDAVAILKLDKTAQVLMIFRRFFFAAPCYLAVGVGIALRFPLLPARPDEQRCLRIIKDQLVNTLLALVLVVTAELMAVVGDSVILEQQSAFLMVVLVILEVAITFLLYHRRGGQFLYAFSEFVARKIGSRRPRFRATSSETEMVGLRTSARFE